MFQYLTNYFTKESIHEIDMWLATVSHPNTHIAGYVVFGDMIVITVAIWNNNIKQF